MLFPVPLRALARTKLNIHKLDKWKGEFMNQRYDDPSYDRGNGRGQRGDRERETQGYRSQEAGRDFYRGGFEEEQSRQFGGSGSGGSTYGASGYGPYSGSGQFGGQSGGQYGSYGAGMDRWGPSGGGYDPYENRQRGQQYGGQQYGQYGPPDWQRGGYGQQERWGQQSGYSQRGGQYGQGQGYGPRGYGQSPYTESQFDQTRGYGPQYGQRYGQQYGQQYGQPQDWSRGRGEQYGDEERSYTSYNPRHASGGYGEWRPPGESYGGYGSTGDYGFGSQGQGRFRDSPGLRYFGTGSYSSGGAGFAGGYGEQRFNAPYSEGGMQGGGWPRGTPQYGYGGYGGRYGQEQREHKPGLLSRMFRRGPKNYQRSDERLREDICERLINAADIDSSEVSITVSSGKVTLEGTVPERYMKHAIEDLVDACPGVQDIDNRIRVVTQREWGQSESGSGSEESRAGGATSSSMSAGATSSGGSTTTGTSGTTGTGGTAGTQGTTGTGSAGTTRRRDS
ncbi:MAG TPA: BON domain-containing protein [Steroidobacteraceae bacterium]